MSQRWVVVDRPWDWRRTRTCEGNSRCREDRFPWTVDEPALTHAYERTRRMFEQGRCTVAVSLDPQHRLNGITLKRAHEHTRDAYFNERQRPSEPSRDRELSRECVA